MEMFHREVTYNAIEGQDRILRGFPVMQLEGNSELREDPLYRISIGHKKKKIIKNKSKKKKKKIYRT